MKISHQKDTDISDSILWYPNEILRNVSSFKKTLRDNRHPTDRITLKAGMGRIRIEHLSGGVATFSRRSTDKLLDKENFVRIVTQDTDQSASADNATQLGGSNSSTPGFFYLFNRGNLECLYANTGASLNLRIAASAHSGRKVNTLLLIEFCGPEEVRDKVLNFVREPKIVIDRSEFKTYVSGLKPAS